MAVRISYESARGCGFRKEGGLYLVSHAPGRPCGKLPIEVSTCPTCGAGIKPARGWTWVDSLALLSGKACLFPDCPLSCPLCDARLPEIGRAGLLWIGEKFYSTPEAFLEEAERMGVSRRISAIPRDFKVGETWILLGHRRAIAGEPPRPRIFRVFRPERIEKIVPEDVDEETVEKLEKRGISPVIVRRLDKSGTPELPLDPTRRPDPGEKPKRKRRPRRRK